MNQLDTTRLRPTRAPALQALEPAGIRHGFFGRQGGVSTGIYTGLNVGTGSNDDPALVAENRRLIAAWFGVDTPRLLTVHQIHSDVAVVADSSFDGPRPRADAIVTDRPGMVCAVLTADCGPVLFADAAAGVVGAAHAGWKGALGGILERTISAMEGLGARRKDIVAALGPSIGPRSYEVGAEFVDRFVSADAGNTAYFCPSTRPGHSMFDLNAYTLDRLARAGVSATAIDRCTYSEEADFFSYRRTTHRGEPDYGRQMSAIVLETR